ncbi:hypothetical protein DSL72_000031 [Monilinia vaccinii-corymbosi]|uniref:Uncharacterized protein n=1 Tax=Monilinia vaccinii-corymbosi TaxID=61207 RepID=A0A8A3PA49_9HELO|nr:hypothetical protein DSL72_000031 [Monilinia vaccinii-corymbosi]
MVAVVAAAAAAAAAVGWLVGSKEEEEEVAHQKGQIVKEPDKAVKLSQSWKVTLLGKE